MMPCHQEGSLDRPRKIWIALPVFNERDSLPVVVRRWTDSLSFLRCDHEFIIVNDGSTDGTDKLLDELAGAHPIRILSHPRNRGLGITIRDALWAATKHAGRDDVIVTMDADNTQPPELFADMLRLMDLRELDVVIASRFQTGAKVVGLSALRRLTSIGALLMFKLVFPILGVRDYTCGYRAYRARCLGEAFDVYGDRFFDERSFASMADVVLKLARMGARFGEVPLTLRYDAKRGKSKMPVASTIWRTFVLLMKRRFERVAPAVRAARSRRRASGGAS
jgi:dolichol-phosphate mannosyltransferase